MPFQSEEQRRAMYAAASGKSTIGIPKSVGEKFIKHKDDNESQEWLNELLLKEMEAKLLKDDGEVSAPVLLTPTEFETDSNIVVRKGELSKDLQKLQISDIGEKLREVAKHISEMKKDEDEPVERFGEDSEAWQTKKGKNPEGGLNAKGRASYNKAHGAHLKAPQPEGGARKKSFCARMKGMKAKLTSSKTAHDPNSRINKSLRKWKCDEDLQAIKADLATVLDQFEQYVDADPCWEGYEQFGMKEKDGKQVPNCVPDAENEPIEQNLDLVPEEPINVKPEANMAGAQGRASGIMFITPDEEVLLIRRGMGGGDYPGTWCVPGGHQKGDETLEETARRECLEETGIDYKGNLEVLYDDGQFCYYVAHNFPKEDVKLNYESSGYDWCSPRTLPLPLHPGIDTAFKVAMAKTETDVAKLISQGILASPQMYANIALLAIRITGTGLAYRSSIGENVWRDPSLYLNEQFLERCNGLMVIMDHPDTQVLTTKEFKNRAVGSIMLPYIKGDEVWGIAKIYDQQAIDEILEGEVSTSPAVVFDQTAGNITLTTENGEPLLIEGVPFLLDHIAIVTKARGSKGVWDKGGDAAGVLLTNNEVSEND
jgi:8-oxo-dGTP pyrophosphatase MutT (NUDIX family)